MQPFMLPYEPTNLSESFMLRSRRETNTVDTTNSRFVNHWQSDPPLLRAVESESYMDMNPTPSRLYRENINQSQPFVIQNDARVEGDINSQSSSASKINNTLRMIQELEVEYQLSIKTLGYDDLRSGTVSEKSREILKRKTEQEELYKLLVKESIENNSLSQNPYFNKYDITSDSRNIIRELRGTVSEDVVDRGIKESRRLLQREMDSRWVPQGFAETRGIDSLSAFELMRPKINNMGKKYF